MTIQNQSVSVTEVVTQAVEAGVGQGVDRARSVNTGVLVDVRSESEYADAHIPTAVNVPLLNDAERAEIGTLYKKLGAEVARRRGLVLVQPKLQDLLLAVGKAAGLEASKISRPTPAQWAEVFRLISEQILGIDFESAVVMPGRKSSEEIGEAQNQYQNQYQQQSQLQEQLGASVQHRAIITQVPHDLLTFYCWRGGARSGCMTLFASLLGFNCRVMSGGHKAFRREVLKLLEAPVYPFKLCVLYGLTGSGKTKIIKQWIDEKKPVIDLEALAHHRGSAFGQIGIDTRGRQKDFENNLYWEIQKIIQRQGRESELGHKSSDTKFIVVEGESRRIGYCQLSESFMNNMLAGMHVKVSTSLEKRVRNIMEEYFEAIPEERMLREAHWALDALKRRLGGEKHREFSNLLDQKNFSKFTEELLIHYYDKTYAHSQASEDFYHGVISGADDWEKITKLFGA